MTGGGPRLAMGLSVHTGWAACCVVGGDPRAPRVVARERVELLGDAERFVFHRAAEMQPDEVERYVRDVREKGVRAGKTAISAVATRAGAEGTLRSCAVIAREGAMPSSIASIVSAHPRIHTSEGLFHRDVFCEAAKACGLDVRVVPPKDLDARAARTFDVTPARLASLLAAAGRALGPPWGKDEKAAALAAWMVKAST